MKSAERMVKSTQVPKCWNCRHLTFGKQTRCFHCPVKHMSFPRNMIPYYACSMHEIVSMKGLAKRKAARWNCVVGVMELKERYTPKASYLSRRKDVGSVLARSQVVRFNVR